MKNNKFITLLLIIIFLSSCSKDAKKEIVIKEKSLDLQVLEVYNEGMKSTKATTKRLRKYLAFVIVISVGINIPHFMDLEVSNI